MKPGRICFLVEDDEDDRDIFNMALKEVDSSIECVFAENGVVAIRKLHTDADFIPLIIIIDMNMPLMNGLQCLEEIKTISRLERVPVYIYSTAADPKGIEDVKKLGAVDFILKPASFDGLIDVLSLLLQPLNSSLI